MPGTVFERVGIDYAGPILVKRGPTRKSVFIKCYVCVFVSPSVTAVHLELVSNLTTEAFLTTLRRFIARRGKPSIIWSDNGSNFIGTTCAIKDLFQFLETRKHNRRLPSSAQVKMFVGSSFRNMPPTSVGFGRPPLNALRCTSEG